MRELFDKHVIKWVELESNNEVLMLKKIERKNRVPGSSIWFVRHRIDNTIQNKESELLQSMLYHSQQNATQYWLTPFLYRLLETETDANTYLKKIDNQLFSHNEKEDTLIQRTRKLIEDKNLDSEIDYTILHEPLGTSFARYWFYKLEYVLWHELNSQYKDWKDYRINARNSIEHISPQTEVFKEDTVSPELLHSFGNLALVSRKFNSELSNKPFREKRERFLYKKNAGDIESLKLDLVYKNKNWGDENSRKHFNFVIEILEQYFSKTQ